MCLLLSLAIAPIQSSDASSKAERTQTRIQLYYGLAEGNYLVGDLNGARLGIEQILRIAPHDSKTLQLKARVEMDSGNPAGALQAIQRAIDSEPDELQHRLLKALVLGHLEQQDAAIAEIEHVLGQSDPASKDAQDANQLLGLLRMAAGDFDEAAEAFNRNTLNAPQQSALSRQLASDAYLEKARSAVDNKELEQALAALDEAIAVYNGSDGAESFKQLNQLRLVRARFLAQTGQSDAAIEALQLLRNTQPDNLEVLITLASLYASTQQWASVEQVIAPIKNQPNLSDIALYLEGRAALARDRAGRARALFEEALELLPDPGNPLRAYVLFYHGLCLERLQRTDAAEAGILEALENGFRPETSEDAIIAARTLLRTDNHERAIPILEQFALQQLIPNAEIWAMLGRAHQAKAQNALALSAFNESLRIDPLQADTLALRGSLLRRFGDYSGALADFASSLHLQPDNASVRYAEGLTALQAGKLTRSYTALKAARDTMQTAHDLDLLLALIAYSEANYATADLHLQQYLLQVSEQANESAHYLDYCLMLQAGKDSALEHLRIRANHRKSSDELGYFLAYCSNLKTRKDLLDLAGQASDPKTAQRQVCEAAFWMAQHELHRGEQALAIELLTIAKQINNPNLPEYQFAQEQLSQLNRKTPLE